MNKYLAVLLFMTMQVVHGQFSIDDHGAIVRSDTLTKGVYLCFTGHDFNEGFYQVLSVLKKEEVKASFFLTGYFIEQNKTLVKQIRLEGHFIGGHSDEHLLYNDWSKRDSLLYTPEQIKTDIAKNLEKLAELGLAPTYFMPPYEWYNQKVVAIAHELNQTTVNFSPGTLSNADYTSPDMTNYRSSEVIFKSIIDYEKQYGMNGFHLLIHPGTSPLRSDKFYFRLGDLINYLKEKDYYFLRF